MTLPPLPPLPAEWFAAPTHSTVIASSPDVREFIESYARLAVAEALERAAKVCEAYLHNVPDEGGDDLDRIGRYSNSTVRRCAAAIRAMKEAP